MSNQKPKLRTEPPPAPAPPPPAARPAPPAAAAGLEPVRPASGPALSTEEASELGQICPMCQRMNLALDPPLYLCLTCGQPGYPCCVPDAASSCPPCRAKAARLSAG